MTSFSRTSITFPRAGKSKRDGMRLNVTTRHRNESQTIEMQRLIHYRHRLFDRSHEARKPAAVAHQLRRRALFGHLAILDYINDVGLMDQAGAVTGEHGRSAAHQSIQRRNDGGLAVGLDAAGWLIEQQD